MARVPVIYIQVHVSFDPKHSNIVYKTNPTTKVILKPHHIVCKIPIKNVFDQYIVVSLYLYLISVIVGLNKVRVPSQSDLWRLFVC